MAAVRAGQHHVAAAQGLQHDQLAVHHQRGRVMHRRLRGMLQDWVAIRQVGLLLVRIGRVRLPCLSAA